MNNKYETVDYGMNLEEIKLKNEYDNLTIKIKKLDLELGTEKRKKLKNIEKINELERQITYHMLARNKISNKLYKPREV
ncbi:MAG: hypothetical protein RR290_00625 [Clostridia bacterium]